MSDIKTIIRTRVEHLNTKRADDRRVLVSKDFTGSDSVITGLRNYHGKHILKPIPGEPEISLEFIQWYREPELGGAFRAPALK